MHKQKSLYNSNPYNLYKKEGKGGAYELEIPG
jgi:hypothetical protein